MTEKPDDQYSPEEAKERMKAALLGARLAGHVSMKAPRRKPKRRRSPASEPGFSLLENAMSFIQRELNRIQKMLTTAQLSSECRAEFYAAQQALVWVLQPRPPRTGGLFRLNRQLMMIRDVESR
jgi:hypothetical protein